MAGKTKIKLTSNLAFEATSNNQPLTQEIYEKLNNVSKVLIRIAVSDEIGIKLEDLQVGVYQERYYLSQDSVMLINKEIFG